MEMESPMIDDTERAAWEIVLRSATRDQARAAATIELAREKLGMTAGRGSVVIGPGDTEPPDETPRDVGPVPVTDAEFYGMSQPKAAAIFLDRAGRTRPQRTEAIVAALRKGGIRFEGKDPAGTFYAILARTPTFHRVGKSTWGLAAWYPNAVRKATKTTEAARPAEDAGTGSAEDAAEQPE